MSGWNRIDKNRHTNVEVYVHYASNWTSEYQANSDYIQWVMPTAAEGISASGYGIFGDWGTENVPLNSVTIIPPLVRHFHAMTDSTRVTLVSLHIASWQRILDAWVEDDGLPPVFTRPVTMMSAELQHLCTRLQLIAEGEASPGGSLMLEALATELAVTCLQRYTRQEPRFRHHEAILRLCDRLKTSFQDTWDIDRMAAIVNLSPSQLLRSFKEITGLPPYKYLLRVRLEHALELLMHSAKSIDAVAAECGFDTRRGFEVALRAYCGMAPSQVRKQRHDSPPRP